MSLCHTLYVLADLSLMLGAIDVTEHAERVHVAKWLMDEGSSSPDPRGEIEWPDERETEAAAPGVTVQTTRNPDDSDWLEFVAFNKWYFTRSDQDPYPSTPHGHLLSASRSWPKLNPYTGRVFAAKHTENTSLRLTKREMRELWRTEAFRDFCRSHIIWYAETFPHHAFGVPHPLRFPQW
jgi:hypothetical protein